MTSATVIIFWILTVLPDAVERYPSTWLFDEFANQSNAANKKLHDEVIKNLDKTLSPAVALSLEYFRSGLYCSEAILRAFNEVYELNYPEDKYSIATGFATGFGEAKCSCGALTGGVLVLSLISGRNFNYESERVSFTLVNELHNKFKEKHGAICCRVLTKTVGWGTAEHKYLCEKYVIYAAQITDDLIKRELKERLPNLDKNFIDSLSQSKTAS